MNKLNHRSSAIKFNYDDARQSLVQMQHIAVERGQDKLLAKETKQELKDIFKLTTTRKFKLFY